MLPDDEFAAEPPAPDVRQETHAEPGRTAADVPDWSKVPTAEETADAVARARRALLELERGQTDEAAHAAEETRTAELGRWRDDDLAAERETGRELDREANGIF